MLSNKSFCWQRETTNSVPNYHDIHVAVMSTSEIIIEIIFIYNEIGRQEYLKNENISWNIFHALQTHKQIMPICQPHSFNLFLNYSTTSTNNKS